MGHSNGCQTCLKRRIKCDEAKPKCKRCEKSGLDCAGYQRPLHFRIAVPLGTEHSNTQSTVAKQTIKRKFISLEKSCTPVPKPLSLVAFKSSICTSYLFSNFVWRSYGHNWLPLAISGKLSPLAFQASSALSETYFGKAHHQPDISTNGSIQYGKAIQALIPALSDHTRGGSEALIIPIMLLLIHDSLHSDPKGSVSHVMGLVQLLMVNGPERFQQEPLRTAFESCRATLITVGIISKRRCFLEEERWQSIPWALVASSKSPQNYLADILVAVPGMLEDYLALSQHGDFPAQEDLVERLETQLTKLFRWRWEWEERNPCTVWEQPSNHKSPAVCSTFSNLVFSDFEKATEIALYNATFMWLVRLLWKITPQMTPEIISSAAQISAIEVGVTELFVTPLSLPDTFISLHEPALEICRVFQYQCRNVEHSRDSALFYLLPIGLAYSALERNDQYGIWIREMLNMSPVTDGYVLGQNVMGFGFYLSSGQLQGTVSRGGQFGFGDRSKKESVMF